MTIGTVTPIEIEEEMKGSYLDYAMSVIVARALPDARDGLKPVQRRILYAMNELGLRYNTPYRKSARIVGEVLGKYHPHGDAPVYDAMVRLAQDFSMRYPLIDGQGNFGSIDNDPPAAMRYTEARLAEVAQHMLVDIEKDTVDFAPNFDDSMEEPTVLPAELPNLLLNGAAGIAVGMATTIPPHNLGEIADAICYLVDNPDASVEELVGFVHGPDFPTGGVILGREGINSAYATGRGRVLTRARADVEELPKGKRQIVVTELPYQTNKAALVERIAQLAKVRKIEGITDLRDESDRHGMRVVMELRRDTDPEVVLNNLYRHTAMQSAFFVNMLALVDGQPRVLSLKTALQQYISFRQNVIVRRSQYELGRATERAHILEGLKIALDNLDAVITTIRRSQSADSARKNLMETFKLTQVQAQAILDMQLRRLAALERKKVNDEYTEVLKNIAYLQDLLANPGKVLFLVKEDLTRLKDKYGDPRRTEIVEEEAREFEATDLIPHRKVVLTLSNRGYFKRMPSETFRVQLRGGRGVTGTREAGGVHRLLVADTHDTLLFFTDRGKVYSLTCHAVREDSSRLAKGTPLVQMLSLDEREQVTTILAISKFVPDSFIVMATRSGQVKKTALSKFASVRSNGLIATRLKRGDELVAVRVAGPDDDIIIVSRSGHAIRFPLSALRAASRASGGVRGMTLGPDDLVADMDVVKPDGHLLIVTTLGYGKCTPLDRYRQQSRGGVGIKTMSISPRSGPVAAAYVVDPAQGELIILSAHGVIIRLKLDSVPVQGRIRRGASLMRVDEGDQVASVGVVDQTLP